MSDALPRAMIFFMLSMLIFFRCLALFIDATPCASSLLILIIACRRFHATIFAYADAAVFAHAAVMIFSRFDIFADYFSLIAADFRDYRCFLMLLLSFAFSRFSRLMLLHAFLRCRHFRPLIFDCCKLPPFSSC